MAHSMFQLVNPGAIFEGSSYCTNLHRISSTDINYIAR